MGVGLAVKNSVGKIPIIGGFFVKFPLKALVFKPVLGDKASFLRVDGLRSDKDGVRNIAVLKSTAQVVGEVSAGFEDENNTVGLVRVGKDDYKVCTFRFDKESQEILLNLKKEEQAKHIYANQVEAHGNRFSETLGQWERVLPFVVLIIAVAVAGGIVLALGTGQISQMNDATRALADAITQNTQVVGSLSDGLSGLSGLRPPA